MHIMKLLSVALHQPAVNPSLSFPNIPRSTFPSNTINMRQGPVAYTHTHTHTHTQSFLYANIFKSLAF